MVNSIVIREVKKSDTESLVKLYTLVGWKLDMEHATEIIRYSISSGYSKVLIADLNGKVIGKVTLDTVFQPYAEIVNVIVHPDYRGKGIGSMLIKECIRRAIKAGHSIIYLMCDPLDRDIHRFYAKLGFLPAILGDPSMPHRCMWLYYFGKGSFVREFLHKHPFTEFSVSRGTKSFHRLSLYSMTWTDPTSDDSLEVFIKGQPGQPLKSGTMPRIGGVRLRLGKLDIDCWIVEKDEDINIGESSRFQLNLLNKGSEPLNAYLSLVPAPHGISVNIGSPSEIMLRPKERIDIEGELTLTSEFSIPLKYLSFPTVVFSITIKFPSFMRTVISAGFNVTDQAF